MLEAFSVMRLNDGNFTSTLKRKLSSAQSESGSTVSNSSLSEKPQRSDSISSSNSSDSLAASRKELEVPGSPQFGPHGELLEERRYSASFRDLHSVQSMKEPWGGACPPYTSETNVLEPPPYTEKPVRTSLVEDDVVATKSLPQSKQKQFSLLHKMRQKSKSAFTSSSSQGQEKRGKMATKVKSPTEKRGFISGIKKLGVSSSHSASSSKSRDGKTGNLKDPKESFETKI